MTETMAKNGSISLGIADLPDNLLTDVAAYLPKTSRAIFAAAMTASPSAWRESNWLLQPSAMSRAIITTSYSLISLDDQHEPWGILDFEEIGKRLAAKLTDDDLGAILTCIDAVNKLKRLKLTGCINMIGNGLNPLRGSTSLEQIDLSLVGLHERPYPHPAGLEPLINYVL